MNRFWKIGTFAIALICTCLMSAVNIFALDTPWIDVPQETTQEDTQGTDQLPPPISQETASTNTSESNEMSEESKSTTSLDSTDVTTEPEEPKKGGCKGDISGFGFVMMLTVACAVCLLVEKKKITVCMKK